MSAVYEIGRFYKVPCVLGRVHSREKWWPVIGSFHEDSDLVKFDNWHWHIDARFVTDDDLWFMSPNFRGTDAARAIPLMLRAGNWPHHMNNLDAPGVFQKDNHPKPELRLRKCKRQWADSPLADKAKWIVRMETHYAHARLADMHCPHRGADLSTMPIDRHGCVECPLHGLRWHVATGKMVKRADWRKAECR